jgi:hypothetical protein
MSAQGLPEFKASELAGAADVLHERLEMHPLDDFFPTIVHDGETVELDVKKWTTFAADPVDFGQPSPYADAQDFRKVRATPIQLRNARPLSNKEISFFRSMGDIRQTNGITQSHESRKAEVLTTIARETMLPPEERKHIMQCEALRGTVDLNIGGNVVSTSYGLTALTAPSTLWSTPGTATPIEDIYAMREEFVDNAEVDPDTVFFERKVFSQYFAPNTDWKSIIKENPGMAKAFAGFLTSDGDLRVHATPRTPFVMFDMIWVPVQGSYTNNAGSKIPRWPTNVLSVCALNAGDGQRVLEWASTRDEYCPDGLPATRVLSLDDPISHKSEYALNGVPLIRIKERCQTWAVGA